MNPVPDPIPALSDRIDTLRGRFRDLNRLHFSRSRPKGLHRYKPLAPDHEHALIALADQIQALHQLRGRLTAIRMNNSYD